MKQHTIYCFVGPSGTGKTTVIKKLIKKYNLTQVKSFTTRKPRHEKEDGHTFISVDEFNKLDSVVAYTFFNGNHYGATKEMVDNADLYAIDIRGVQMLREKYDGDIKVIYLGTSKITAAKRMMGRGDSIKKITSRLINDGKCFNKRKVKELEPDLIIPTNKYSVDEVVELVRSFMSVGLLFMKAYS